MIRYEINEEKHTVVARFSNEDHVNYLETVICKSIFNVSSLGWLNLREIIQRELKGYEKMIGKAKCHPDDEFDIEVGKRIAKEKLLIKWYKFKYHILRLVYMKIRQEFNLLLYRFERKVGTICGGTYQ